MISSNSEKVVAVVVVVVVVFMCSCGVAGRAGGNRLPEIPVKGCDHPRNSLVLSKTTAGDRLVNWLLSTFLTLACLAPTPRG